MSISSKIFNGYRVASPTAKTHSGAWSNRLHVTAYFLKLDTHSMHYIREKSHDRPQYVIEKGHDTCYVYNLRGKLTLTAVDGRVV